MKKVILRALFFFSHILILFTGCKQKEDNIFIVKALSINLMLANERISQNTNTMLQFFRNYSKNPKVSEKTNPALVKMEQVGKITAVTIAYLDQLKRILKIEAGLRLINLKETFNERDYDAVKSIFNTKKEGIEVYKHLIKYQTSIQQISPELFDFLKNPYYFFDFFSTPNQKLENEFTNIYFDKINTISALAVIAKFENDVRIYENKAVRFFFEQVAVDLPVMAD